MKLITGFACSISLAVAGCIAGMVLAELSLRLMYDEPAQERAMDILGFVPIETQKNLPVATYYTHRPACSTCKPRTNSLGFPGDDPPRPAPGLYRIFVVGDSVCAGYGLDYESTFPAKLEEHLSSLVPVKAAVSSFCVGGFDLPEIAAVLKHQVMPEQPDMVVALHFVNDDGITFLTRAGSGSRDSASAAMISPEADALGPLGFIPAWARSLLARHSFLFQEVRWRLIMLWLEYTPPEELPERSERELDELIRQEISQVSAFGADFLAIMAPPASHGMCGKCPSWNLDRCRNRCGADDARLDRLAYLFKSRGARVFDLRPFFRVPDPGFLLDPEHPSDMDHWGKKAHDIAAEAVAEYISNNFRLGR